MKIPKNWNSISLNTFTKLSNLVDTDNDVTEEGDKLAKCIHKLYKSVRKKEYDYNHFLELSIGKSYSTILFFWSFVKSYYLKYLKHSLIQMEKMTIQEVKQMKEQGVDIRLNKANVNKLIKMLTIVIGLTNGNPLKLEEAFKYGFYDSCIYYLYKLENKKK